MVDDTDWKKRKARLRKGLKKLSAVLSHLADLSNDMLYDYEIYEPPKKPDHLKIVPTLTPQQEAWLAFISEPANVHHDSHGSYIDPREYRQWAGTSNQALRKIKSFAGNRVDTEVRWHALRKVKAFVGERVTNHVKRVNGTNRRIWRLNTTHEELVKITSERFNTKDLYEFHKVTRSQENLW